MTAELIARLRAVGCVFAEDEARLLVAEAASPADLETMVARRAAGQPLEYVLGWAEFCGLRILVDVGVFVPRRRTEFVAQQAIALVPSETAIVVDLCCGAGAIGAAIRAAHENITLYASDCDPLAANCARRNLGDSQVLQGDLYDSLPEDLRGRVDVLTANAPYVPTDAIALMPPEAREHEARSSLDGGSDGLDIARRVVMGAPRWLAPGGHLLVETSQAQAQELAAEFTRAGLAPRIASDEEVGATIVIGSRARSATLA